MGFDEKQKTSTLAYRPDIDGLRGLAVLLVIAFHFGLGSVTGGYIGVDIFFVISGYLITSILSQGEADVQQLVRFYERRIKRLLPMLLVFIVATSAVATVFLLPNDFLDYFHSIYSTLLFRSNSYFHEKISAYFSVHAAELPLLHTWSLSIEWQFYFLFPALFLFARKRLSPRLLFCAVALATLALTLRSIYESSDTANAYFHTSARLFELLIGGMAALIKTPPSFKYRQFVVYAAVVLLLVISITLNQQSAFPGLNAFFVCMLTATCILLGEDNRLIGNRQLVHIGRISYSAYLWHWPPLAFCAYLQLSLTPLLKLVVIAVVLCLAHCSYQWIETPGRRLRLNIWKLILVFWLIPLVLTVGLYKIGNRHDGWFGRMGAESSHIYENVKPYLDTKKLGCISKPGDSSECSFGDLESKTELYLIGDSHAGHYRWFANVLATQAHIHATSLVHSECLVMYQGTQPYRNEEHAARCKEAVQSDYARILEAHPKYVLIAQRWVGYPFDDVSKLKQTIELLLSKNITPVVLGPVAENGQDLKACFYRHIKLRTSYQGECDFPENNSFVDASMTRNLQLLAEIRRQYPAAIWIDTRAVLCQDGLCHASLNGVPLYDDTHHINGYGSALLAKIYSDRYGNPLRK